MTAPELWTTDANEPVGWPDTDDIHRLLFGIDRLADLDRVTALDRLAKLLAMQATLFEDLLDAEEKGFQERAIDEKDLFYFAPLMRQGAVLLYELADALYREERP